MILWDTIYRKLINKGAHYYDIDVRYLSKWIRLYPEIFPKFIKCGNYDLKFNYNLLRWELYKIKI